MFICVFLLEQVTETQKENKRLEMSVMERGKLNSDHY